MRSMRRCAASNRALLIFSRIDPALCISPTIHRRAVLNAEARELEERISENVEKILVYM